MIANDNINKASSSGRVFYQNYRRKRTNERTCDGPFPVRAPGNHLMGDFTPTIDDEGGTKMVGIIWYALIAYDGNKLCLRMTLRELS